MSCEKTPLQLPQSFEEISGAVQQPLAVVFNKCSMLLFAPAHLEVAPRLPSCGGSPDPGGIMEGAFPCPVHHSWPMWKSEHRSSSLESVHFPFALPFAVFQQLQQRSWGFVCFGCSLRWEIMSGWGKSLLFLMVWLWWKLIAKKKKKRTQIKFTYQMPAKMQCFEQIL